MRLWCIKKVLNGILVGNTLKMCLRSIFLIVILQLNFSCTDKNPIQIEKGLAVVFSNQNISMFNNSALRIYQIDYEAQEYLPDKETQVIKVLPGIHKLYIEFIDGGRVGRGEFEINLKANRIYEIYAKEKKNSQRNIGQKINDIPKSGYLYSIVVDDVTKQRLNVLRHDAIAKQVLIENRR